MKKKKKIVIFLCAVVGVVLLAYVGVAAYFTQSFLPNTSINGVLVEGMSSQEAEISLEAQAKRYILEIQTLDGSSEEIKGNEIDIKPIFNGTIETSLKKQNLFLWVKSLWSNTEITLPSMVKIDEQLVKRVILNLKCMNTGSWIAPQNAEIVYENGYQIKNDVQGNTLDTAKTEEVIIKAMKELESKVSLEAKDCYLKPTIKADHQEMLAAFEQVKKIASTNIILNAGEKRETVDEKIIHEMLTISSNFQITLDDDALKEYIKTLAKTYNTLGKQRPFLTSYGTTITLTRGTYGWLLDEKKEFEQLKAEIMEGKSVTREPNFSKKAASHGVNDYGDSYVEVNLTAQHVFVYIKGQKVMETDIVSGDLAKGNVTPVGIYGIRLKKSPSILVGADYRTPVKYWMPFHEGYGLHDANWRSKFGKVIYKTDGSHGCVNMPPSKARELYGMSYVGMPVILYQLSGTEYVAPLVPVVPTPPVTPPVTPVIPVIPIDPVVPTDPPIGG